MYVCTCIREQKDIAGIHAYALIHVHTYIHTYLHACIHTCMHTYIRDTALKLRVRDARKGVFLGRFQIQDLDIPPFKREQHVEERIYEYMYVCIYI